MLRARILLAAVSVSLAALTLAASPPLGAAVTTHPTGQAWESTYVHRNPYLVCLRSRESPGHRALYYEDGYVYATGNGYYGAYQYRPSTWVTATRYYYGGWSYVSGTTPDRISQSIQDRVTLAYARATGGSPWGYACAGYLR